MRDSAGKSAPRDGKTEVLAALIRARAKRPVRRLLVVGCGSGLETAVLASALRCEAIGIDLHGKFDPMAAAAVELRRGDATRLEFDDGAFDVTFSYHVLEHVPQYRKAIREMRRVTATNGLCCIGTPNRDRAIGYLGSKDATPYEKLVWNFWDWKARLRGRFRNELGAHAGFSSAELGSALNREFARVEEVTLPYYSGVYHRQAAAVRLLDRSGLGRFLFPAVYFIGTSPA